MSVSVAFAMIAGLRARARASLLFALAAAGASACIDDVRPTPVPPDEGAAPSCAGLEAMCGPSGGVPCCEVGEVPGGEFERDNDAAYPARVSTFGLDRFEVTVGRFRKFVEAYPASRPAPGDGAHPRIEESGWRAEWDESLPPDQDGLREAIRCNDPAYQTWTEEPGAKESHPINCVGWAIAFAFCAWDGGRLPTEAEWNYAAAGGNARRPYPWGAEPPDGSFAVYECRGDGSDPGVCALADILHVGSRSQKGDGLWGHADLAGSVWEWTLDWHGVYPSECNDCASLQEGTGRAARGGSWVHEPIHLATYGRIGYDPLARDSWIGLRCARDR